MYDGIQTDNRRIYYCNSYTEKFQTVPESIDNIMLSVRENLIVFCIFKL